MVKWKGLGRKQLAAYFKVVFQQLPGVTGKP
jgi:hypothetical protein